MTCLQKLKCGQAKNLVETVESEPIMNFLIFLVAKHNCNTRNSYSVVCSIEITSSLHQNQRGGDTAERDVRRYRLEALNFAPLEED